MKKILVLLVALLMVGCEAKDTEKPKQIIKEAIKQEQRVDKPKEEVKEEPKKEDKQVEKELPKKEEPKKEEPKKEAPKKTVKEPSKKEQPKKKEQDDNIDPETGLAKVKDGTHLEEEAKKQEEQGIIEPEDDSVWTKDYCPECQQPVDDCICNGDTDNSIDYNNTPIYNDYRDPDEFNNEDEDN